ncbi:MAG: protein-glutamate O-methyltransferase CheR [Sporomusaceae bacterium]|nr:protein-glutamate O-methyltransferase CheR [Sporomusaceae bacterium]
MLVIGDKEFKALTDYIQSEYGINLTKKRNLIEGRLSSMLLEKGFTSFRDYLEALFRDPTKRELTELVNRVTTNHTFFMREISHFEYFQKQVLPYLASVVKNKDLRIWSAGCSSGEEPYTLAMLLADFFAEEKYQWNRQLLATDISVQVLEQAEQGLYDSDAVQQIPASWRLNYFEKVNRDAFQIVKELRREVVFRLFNLMDPFPFRKKFHVIFCRNVMIYFDQATKNELVRKFYEATESGGYLFIGHSESLSRQDTHYKYIMPAVYRKE